MTKEDRNKTEAPRPQAAAFTPCCCAGAGPRLSALMLGVTGGPAFSHFRNAGVEVLLGLRAILDTQIEVMTRKQQKGTKVPVE